MCVVSGISLAGSLLSLAGGVYGGVQSYNQSKEQAQAQVDAHVRQAEAARHAANETLHKSTREEMQKRREGHAKQGELTARIAASNMRLDSGSSLDILSDTAALSELESLDIRDSAMSTAKHLWNNSNNYLEDASKVKRLSGLDVAFDIGPSLLSGVADILPQISDISKEYYAKKDKNTIAQKEDNSSEMYDVYETKPQKQVSTRSRNKEYSSQSKGPSYF